MGDYCNTNVQTPRIVGAYSEGKENGGQRLGGKAAKSIPMHRQQRLRNRTYIRRRQRQDLTEMI